MNCRRRTTPKNPPAHTCRRPWSVTALLLLVVLTCGAMAEAFVSSSSKLARRCSATSIKAQISEKEASAAIDKVVKALQKDRDANEELGRLQKVNNVLGCV